MGQWVVGVEILCRFVGDHIMGFFCLWVDTSFGFVFDMNPPFGPTPLRAYLVLCKKIYIMHIAILMGHSEPVDHLLYVISATLKVFLFSLQDSES